MKHFQMPACDSKLILIFSGYGRANDGSALPSKSPRMPDNLPLYTNLAQSTFFVWTDPGMFPATLNWC